MHDGTVGTYHKEERSEDQVLKISREEGPDADRLLVPLSSACGVPREECGQSYCGLLLHDENSGAAVPI